jgi:hypothetical protein
VPYPPPKDAVISEASPLTSILLQAVRVPPGCLAPADPVASAELFPTVAWHHGPEGDAGGAPRDVAGFTKELKDLPSRVTDPNWIDTLEKDGE